jgi:hypothetical protein
MSIFDFFNHAPDPEEGIDPAMPVEDRINRLAGMLKNTDTVDNAVLSLLRTANVEKSKGHTSFRTQSYGFNVYQAELTPAQKRIIERLEALDLKAEVKDVPKKYWSRSKSYDERYLVVSW